MKHRVRIQHGTAVAFETIYAESDEEAITKARARANRTGFFCLPMAYTSIQIVDSEESEDE